MSHISNPLVYGAVGKSERDSKVSPLRIPNFARLHAIENERAARWRERNNKPPTVPKGFRLTNAVASGDAQPPRTFSKQYQQPHSTVSSAPKEEQFLSQQQPFTSAVSKFVNKVKEARVASSETYVAPESAAEQRRHAVPEEVAFLDSPSQNPSTLERTGPPSSNVLYPGAFRSHRTVQPSAADRAPSKPTLERWKSAAPPQPQFVDSGIPPMRDDIVAASGNEIILSRVSKRIDDAIKSVIAVAPAPHSAVTASCLPACRRTGSEGGISIIHPPLITTIAKPNAASFRQEIVTPSSHQAANRIHEADGDPRRGSEVPSRASSAPTEVAGSQQVNALAPAASREAAPTPAAKVESQILGIEGARKDKSELRRLIETIPSDSLGQTFSSLDFYQFGKTLGEGAYGKVKLGLQMLTGEKVAIKMFESSKIAEPNAQRRVAREIRILKALHHPRIVRLFEVVESSTRKHVIMEYASGGDLCHYVREKKRLAESESARIFLQICDALMYCHRRGVVHRDVKLDNLLLDAAGNVKLADFGFSITFFHGQKLKKACGSPSYAAPEIVTRKAYSPPGVDVWSLGVVLYAMVCGYFPFHGSTSQDLCRRIASGKFECPPFMSAECRDLVRRMLTVDTSRRIGLGEAEQHTWCKSYRALCGPFGHAHRAPPSGESRIDAEVSVDSLYELKFAQADVDGSLVREVEKLGFPRQYVTKCVGNNRHNLVSTCYWLMQMKRSAQIPFSQAPAPPSPPVLGERTELAVAVAGGLKPRPPVDRPGSAALSSCTTYRRLGASEIDVA